MMKKLVKIMIIIMIILIITNISYAKFTTIIKGGGKVELKMPILILEKSNVITGEISKVNNLYQSDFSVKNYLENNNELINEINFEYTIKLIPTILNFPVKYTLINLDTNEEMILDDKLETMPIVIGTDKTIHRYRVIVNWCEILSTEEIEENLDVRMKIKATQIEKENL